MISLFKNEQQRGIIGYIGSAFIANFINVLLSKYTTLTVQQSTFVAIYMFGNLFLYSIDIMFAKENFNLSNYNGITNYYGPVSYMDISTRLKWFGHSLYQKYFFRFIITVVLDTIIGLSLLNFTIDTLDKYEILKNWKYRNYVVATIVATFTYFLYLSTLRFKWAYEYKENSLMNILVMVWLSLAILIIVDEKTTTYKNIKNQKWRYMY
jgi:hypothetical protein